MDSNRSQACDPSLARMPARHRPRAHSCSRTSPRPTPEQPRFDPSHHRFFPSFLLLERPRHRLLPSPKLITREPPPPVVQGPREGGQAPPSKSCSSWPTPPPLVDEAGAMMPPRHRSASCSCTPRAEGLRRRTPRTRFFVGSFISSSGTQQVCSPLLFPLLLFWTDLVAKHYPVLI